MSESLVLYCKSYRTDLNRVIRLAKSVDRFNSDKIPFYISVPRADLALFTERLSGSQVTVIDDEKITRRNPKLDFEKIQLLPGYISQQIVKSEFWRLGFSESYLCLDSDAYFIRPFDLSDFLCEDDMPYTVMDEGRGHLEESLAAGWTNAVDSYFQDAQRVQNLFGRKGKVYAFGPFPEIWHRAVWESLDQHYLQSNNMSFMDAILLAPLESRWYGEALLRYKAIPLMPCQPLFKVYHYAWQRDKDMRANIGPDQLSHLYSGVIYQSAWEREMDWPSEGGNWLSHVARRLRRGLGRM